MKNTLSVLIALVALSLSLAALWLGMASKYANDLAPSEPPGAAKLQVKSSPLAPSAGAPAPKPAASLAGENSGQSVQNVIATTSLPLKAAPATKEALENEATFVAQQLVDTLPDQAISLHVQAMLYAQLHNTAEAQQLWQRCIELDQKSEPYYVNLAAIAIDRGEIQLAIDTLRSAIAAGIDSLDINHHLGVALNSIGQFEEAAAVAQKVLDASPNSGAHLFILGQAQLQMGDNEKAERSLLRAIELGIRSKAIYFSLFNVSMRLGKKEQAAKYREIYSNFKEKDLDAEERYKVLSEEEARRVCVSVLSEATAIYRAISDLNTAEHLLLRVLALEPENKAGCADLAQLYSDRNELGNEIVARSRMIELDSLNLLNYLFLAKTLDAANKPAEAEAQIKKAISLAPQTVTGYAAMADFLMEQKQPAKAQWYVEQAIRIQPNPQGFELLAKVFRAQGKTEAAGRAMDMAKQLAK